MVAGGGTGVEGCERVGGGGRPQWQRRAPSDAARMALRGPSLGAADTPMHVSDWYAAACLALVPFALDSRQGASRCHICTCRYATFCALAGVEPSDKWRDPTTKLIHDIDGINQWPSLATGVTSARTLPTTHKSLLVDDGKGHMWCVRCSRSSARTASLAFDWLMRHYSLSMVLLWSAGNSSMATRREPTASTPMGRCMRTRTILVYREM